MADNRNNGISTLGILLVMAMLAAIIVAFAPGMLLVGIFQMVSGVFLDRGQLWAFAVAVSALVFLGFYLKSGRAFVRAVKGYLVLSLALSALCAFLYYGFKVEIFGFLLQEFFGWGA